MSFRKGAEGAEVVGAEVVGAEVSNPRLDVGVGANERSWRVYMSFGSFFRFCYRNLAEYGRNFLKQRFFF